MHKYNPSNPEEKIIGNNNYHLLRAAINQFGKPPKDLTEIELSKAWQQAIKGYEIERLVLSSDEAQGVFLTQEMVQKSLDTIKQRYQNEEDFYLVLQANDIDENKIHDALYREMLVETVLDKVASRAADISDMDIMIYYYLHKDKFSKPETRRAHHILITINEDYDENKRDTAYARLEDIRKRLIKKPARFAEQALKHSECPTAMQEGLLGNIPRGELYPELDDVLFNMKQGEISSVIESPVGFHILYCKEIDNAGPVPLEQATDKIREHLEHKRRRMCQKNWLRELTNNDSQIQKSTK